MALEQYANNAQSTLSAGIDNAVTSLSVVSASSFPSTGNFRIIIDSEIMLVTGVSGTTFTVTRGQESTSAAAHSGGATVTHELTAASLANLCQARLLGTRVALTSTQSISSGSTTALTGYTVTRDDLSAYSAGTPSRLTAPSTGWYAIFAHTKWAAIASGKTVNDFRVNGSIFIGSTSLTEAAGSFDPDMAWSTLYYFTAADYVEITCFQNSGGPINITAAEFCLQRLF